MYKTITEKELKIKLKSIEANNDQKMNKMDKVIQYLIPKIECHWPIKRSDYFDTTLRDDSNEYLIKNSNVSDNDIKEYLLNICVGDFSSWAYPLAIEKYRMINLVDFMHFIGILDDQQDNNWGEVYSNFDKSEKHWIAFSEMIDGEYNSSMPIYFKEFKSLVEKISKNLSEKQIVIFKETIKNWGVVNRLQQSSIKTLRILDMETLLDYRTFTVGTSYALFLIEYALNIELNEFERNHQLMIDFNGEVAKHVVCVNDLYSFRKEYINSNGNLCKLDNILAALINYHKLNVNKAILFVKALIEECNHNCNRIKSEIMATTELKSLNVEMYLVGAEYFMSGNLIFHKLSPRYHGINFVGDISETLINITLQ